MARRRDDSDNEDEQPYWKAHIDRWRAAQAQRPTPRSAPPGPGKDATLYFCSRCAHYWHGPSGSQHPCPKCNKTSGVGPFLAFVVVTFFLMVAGLCLLSPPKRGGGEPKGKAVPEGKRPLDPPRADPL